MRNTNETYKDLFKDPSYNLHSDEEKRFQFVLNYIKQNEINSIIDIGSGRGNLLRQLKIEKPDLQILSVDLEKFHELDVPFVRMNIENINDRKAILNLNFDLLTCLDVLEHIEYESVNDVFEFFSKISKHQIFSIANHPDIQNGLDIHLIQEDAFFWTKRILKYLNIKAYSKYKFFSKPDDFPESKRYNYLYIFICDSLTGNKIISRFSHFFIKEKVSLIFDSFKLIFK
jgi:hypothetical protein